MSQPSPPSDGTQPILRIHKPAKKKHAEDPYIEIVQRLQRANKNPRTRLCDCVNDRHNVCKHLFNLAVKELERLYPKSPLNSFREKTPATPIEHRHLTPEWYEAKYLRVENGESVCIPQDRPPDPYGVLDMAEEGGDDYDD